MRIFQLFCSFVSTSPNLFFGGGRRSKEREEQLSPIRYVGDPTEIYLA